jgi:hypothetical protein
MLKRSLFLALGLAAALTASQAKAGPIAITDLFNTGVDNAGNPLGPHVADPHYAISALGPAEVVATGQHPFPPWVPNPSNAQWIAPLPNTSVPNGIYDYTTHFTLNSANLASVVISGLLTSDDQVQDVLLNGHSLGITTPTGPTIPTAGFTSLHPFSISGSISPFFIEGNNTLVFHTANLFGSVTGLLVQQTGSYSLIPEPTSMALLGIGLSGLLTFRRFRKR